MNIANGKITDLSILWVADNPNLTSIQLDNIELVQRWNRIIEDRETFSEECPIRLVELPD